MAETEDYQGAGAAAAHATTHQDGGSDEISVTALSGLLADGQTPLAHKTSHQLAGSDALSVAGLSGLLADGQNPLAHKTSHQDGGADEISVAGLSGVLADDQHVIDSEVLAVAEDKTKKGAASGYCDLDASILVPLNRIPTPLTGKDADTLDGSHAAAFEAAIAAGTTAQYWRGDKSWQTRHEVIFTTFINNVYSSLLIPATGKFDAKINGNPTATSVVYDGDTNEALIVPNGTLDGRLMLYNSTRGTYRKITTVNVSTNTITTESSADAWADNDDITANSQTNAGVSSILFMDLDISAVVPANAVAVYLLVGIYANAGDCAMRFHPWEAFATGKAMQIRTQAATVVNYTPLWVPVISQKITINIGEQVVGNNFNIAAIRCFGYAT